MNKEVIFEFRKELIALGISLVAIVLSFFDIKILGFDCAWIAIVLCGIPILYEAAKGLITAFDIRADVLVALALLASLYLEEYFAAAEVAFIMQLGSLLEEITTAKAKSGIEKLVKMKPVVAHRVVNDAVEDIAADDAKVDDILRILPGESIPADGIVVSGSSSVNQALMTGEPIAEDKVKGDSVISGSINLYGTFDMKAQKVGKDCEFQRLISMVESADAGKAKIVRLADRWATWVVIVAVLAAIAIYFITGELIRSVTVLVVFCPCALVLATPTAIMAAIGNLTKHGVLVKEGDALERLAQSNISAFDKTGTITLGRPEITVYKSLVPEYSDKEILEKATAVEMDSEHPLAQSVIKAYKAVGRTEDLLSVSGFNMVPGLGVEGTVEGKLIQVGTFAWLETEEQINALREELKDKTPEGATVSVVCEAHKPIGILCMEDEIRQEANEALTEIKNIGITPILITGDNEKNAKVIAAKSGISRVFANCLPADKLKTIESLNRRGNKVAMIGDGFNDAPALKKAYVGIAMGARGSDIAVDAADIVMIDDSIKDLPHLFALSKRMMVTIKCNLTFSMVLNFVAIALAMTGILNPVTGALVHNAGSVFVIICSAMLLNWKAKLTTKA